MSADAALELLTTLLGKDRVEKELEFAKGLCQFVNYVPVGLYLIAGTAARARERIMLADILAQLQKQASAGESGVTAAFELNWQSLEPEVQKLASLLSLFALAPIPWSLVESAASASHLEFDLKANCAVLVERYLLQELAEDTYQIL